MVLSKKFLPLRSMVVILTAAIGTVTASASVLPFLTGALGQKPTGNFLLTEDPSSLTVNAGGSANSTVTLASVSGFRGTVALYTDSVGAYFSGTFANRTLTLTVNGTSTTTFSLKAPITASGAYRIIITGTASFSGKRTVSSSAAISVTVLSKADFDIQTSPSSLSETIGQTASVGISVDSLGGFNGTVGLVATTPFGFISIMGGQDPLTLTAGRTATTTLQISTTLAATTGTYNITVTGASGQHVHTIIIMTTITDPVVESLVLVNSSLSSSTNMTISLQDTGNVPITLVKYTVIDSLGDIWTLAPWSGPVIGAGATQATNILIAASCGACTYTGILFGFQQFQHGQTYTVTVSTSRGNVFQYTVKV